MDFYIVVVVIVIFEIVVFKKFFGYIGCFKDQGFSVVFIGNVYIYRLNFMNFEICK